MDSIRDELEYEEKMDEITAQLEKLILDAVIAALDKIRKRNREFDQIIYRGKIMI
jgi:hypothetical protein